MEEGNRDGDGEVVLLSKTAAFEDKLFCFEFKENDATQFLKISDRTTSSFIVLPSAAISCFLDILNHCLGSQKHEAFKWKLTSQDKVLSFSVERDKWGRYLKALDASMSKQHGCLIIPSGHKENKVWEAFKHILLDIGETSRVFFPPYQDNSDDPAAIGSDNISGRCVQQQNSSQSEPTFTLHNGNGNFRVSKVMESGEKRFTFDLGDNKRGRYLKISEVKAAYSSFIIVPVSCLKDFHDKLGCFLKITNESRLS